MDIKLDDFQIAQIEILKALKKKGYKWRNVNFINRYRYALILGKYNCPNVLLCFKRNPFFNFGKEFRMEGATGIGETLNCEHLQLAIQKDVKDIYVMYPDRKIYTIPLKEFLCKSYKRTTKEGKETRSISIHELKRFEVINEIES